MARRQKVGRVDVSPFARANQPEDVDCANALVETFQIHVMAQADEVELDAVVVPVWRQRIVLISLVFDRWCRWRPGDGVEEDYACLPIPG